jgi:hypothetical protein
MYVDTLSADSNGQLWRGLLVSLVGRVLSHADRTALKGKPKGAPMTTQYPSRAVEGELWRL